MRAPAWLLRHRLRVAARLLRRKAINEWQYSALALDLGYRLLGEPLALGAKVGYWTFAMRLSEELVRDLSIKGALEKSLRTYGPYNLATSTLKPRGAEDFVWDSDQQNRAKMSGLYLSASRRSALAIQSWWEEQERVFPLFTKLTAFLLGLVIGAAAGRLSR